MKFFPVAGEKIKVIITDDHALCRTAIRDLLEKNGDVEVIAEAEHGGKLLELLDCTHADVVTLGISMPVMNGFDTLPPLRRRFPALKVVMLTMHADAGMVRKSLELGANSYITKDSAGDEIYEAVRACH